MPTRLNAASETRPGALSPSPSRRRFIELLGGGAVVAATATIGACSTEYPDASVQAWRVNDKGASDATAGGDLRVWMLAHALLAPNPHNRQPWIADLRRPGEIALMCDGERLLPETDPFGRQILIGCGAFIELAVMTAAERGVATQVELFPDGAPGPQELPAGRVVARLTLLRDARAARDPLFAQITKRRTNKNAYDSAREVAAADWQSLFQASMRPGLVTGAVTETVRREQVRQLARKAWEIEMTTAHTWLESARLLRIGPSEIEQHRDGISINGRMPRLLDALGLFDRSEIPAPGNSSYKQGMNRWSTFETGSGFFWIASQGNARSAQIESGRAFVRTQLAATAAGIEVHPLSQALQEFAEVSGPYREMPTVLGLDPQQQTLQMLCRVGHALEPAVPTPRRPLQNLIRA